LEFRISGVCRSGSFKTVSRELAKYKLDLWEYRRSDGTRVALNQQLIVHSSMEMGMLISTKGQTSPYTRESYQQLRG
jgi:hypothetical protein